MYKEKIEKWFALHEEKLVSDLAALVAIPSVGTEAVGDMPYGVECAKVLDEACVIGERLGLEMHNLDKHIIYTDLNNKEPHLGILAHLDVVAEGEGWTFDPYTLTEKDGIFYGRGVSDDKGPSLAAMYALACVKEIAPDLSRNARVILGADEERGSGDIRHYRNYFEFPPYVFSPDAGYPVINTEKGGFKPEFGAKWDECKALPRIVSASGGHTGNIIPQYCKASVEGMTACEVKTYADKAAAETGVTFDITEENGLVNILATGTSAHASTPAKGNNANTAMLTLLASLPMADCEGFRRIKGLNKLFPHGDGEGRALGIAMEDEISGALSLSFTIFEYSLTGCSGYFDARVPFCSNEENTVAVCEKSFAEYGIGYLRPVKMKKAHHTPADTPIVKSLLKVYEEYTGLPGYCYAIGGGTYIHGMSGGVAFGCAMPGEETNIHGADELMRRENLLMSAKIFAQVIIDMCK